MDSWPVSCPVLLLHLCEHSGVLSSYTGKFDYVRNLFVSQVVNDSLNPVWNQTFDFVVEDGLHDMLILEVWDHDTFGKVQTFYIFLYFSIKMLL